MKKLTDVKNYISLYFRTLSRERVAIFICIPIALIALFICAIMLLKSDKKEYEVPEDAIFVTEMQTQKYTYSPSSPYSLEFESLGNGNCAVVGVGGFDDKELKIPAKSPEGDKVIKINSNAFYGCASIEAISIPECIEEIGESAFRGCSSLIYIDVDMNNEYFTSIGGVLFSKDKTRLICYPKNKTGERYYLNQNVKIIDDYAFEGIKSISAILYPKSTADFETIKIGKGNEVLHTLPITCNYSGGK